MTVLPHAQRRVVPPGGFVCCDGDSITAGFGLSAPDFYPTVLGNSLGPRWTVTNHAVSGRVLQDMLDNVSTLDSQYNPAQVVNWVVILGGCNDIASGSYTNAGILSKIASYTSGRRAAGFRVAVCTIMPRGGFEQGTEEADRVTMNSTIRGSLATYGDRLVDLAADAHLADIFDATYYQAADHIHPTAAGAVVIAGLVRAQIGT